MKRYEFRAVRAGKQEMIMGFAFSAIIMLPILAIQLGLFYSGLDKSIKLTQSSLLKFGYVLVVLLIVNMSFYLLRKTQEKLVKSYVVELNESNIRILENGKEIMIDSVVDCEIIKKIKEKPTKNISLIIYTDTDKVTFRLRGKNWKSIMGNYQPNPLGTTDVQDMETVISLYNNIKEVIEK